MEFLFIFLCEEMGLRMPYPLHCPPGGSFRTQNLGFMCWIDADREKEEVFDAVIEPILFELEE